MDWLKNIFQNLITHPYAVIACTLLVLSAWYMYPEAREFPMDDTYIHFVYAENLADTGQLMFSAPGEKGIGTTSLLWVLLLAAGKLLELPIYLTARSLGWMALFLSGVFLYRLLRPALGEKLSLICALLVTASGHMLWFALSGMETILFLMLALLTLLFYRNKQWTQTGITAGLLMLCRPDGLALPITIGLIEIWRTRRIPRHLVRMAMIVFVLASPWFIYIFLRTGSFLPTSAMGKQLSMRIIIGYGLANNGVLRTLSQIPQVTYFFMWAAYLLEFALGGLALPPPRLAVETSVNRLAYDISIWAIIGWLTALLPLAGIGVRTFFRKRGWDARRGKTVHPITLLFLWGILHNLTFLLFLPTPGTASRYGVINHVLLWIALTMILVRYVTQPHYRRYLAVWLVSTAIFNTVSWNGVYDANIIHMQEVRMQAAAYFRDQVPEEDVCGVFDIGAMRYFSRRPFVDMGGLIDPDLRNMFLQDRLPEYLIQNGVTCLIVPGRSGSVEDGFLDISRILGFDTSPVFTMRTGNVIQIDRDTWLKGYLPTMNYQATVTFYYLDYASATNQ